MANPDPSPKARAGAGGRSQAAGTLYVISVAAKLAGMHPQTLRLYDRLGLVKPTRSAGGNRRYTRADVEALRQIQTLSQDEGINLAGIAQIMDLRRRLRAADARLERAEAEVARLEAENSLLRQTLGALRDRIAAMVAAKERVFAADPHGHVTPYRRGGRPDPRLRPPAGYLGGRESANRPEAEAGKSLIPLYRGPSLSPEMQALLRQLWGR